MPMSDTSQLLARDTFFANAAAASKTYAPVATAPKEVVTERLPLTRLPSAMRNMGWDTAAALMQRWFDSPAWQMPDSWKDSKGGGAAPPPATLLPSSRVDDTTVRMDCALRFVRCQKAVAEARDKTTPANKISFPRSTGQLIIRLRDMGWDGVKPCTFGTTKLCLLLCACPHRSEAGATHPSMALEGVRVIGIKSSTYHGKPGFDGQARCSNWKLNELQAGEFFRLSERYDESPYSQFYQMSCVISGELIAEGKTWRFEIDGGGTAIWQREDEVRYWGCSTQACEPLVMLLTDFMQD